MGGRVKVLCAALLLAVVTFSEQARADFVGIDPTSQGKVGARLDQPSHWLVGVTLDRAAGPTRISDTRIVEDQFLGVSATYHRSWFAANVKLVFAPRSHAPRTPATLVAGVRFAAHALGRDFTYGVNAQGEANLENHYCLLHASPVELGADLYVHRGLHIQLFAGIRYALAGSIIKHFLIDPNGFPSDIFEVRMQDRLDDPWEGYVSLVFARRID